MDTTQIITLLAGVAAIIFAGLAYRRSGQPLTLQGVTETLESAKPLAEQIREVAEVVVSGVEQLKANGTINTNDEAFAEAMDHLQHWFPEVDAKRLVPFIEDAVRGVKLGVQMVEAAQGK